MPDLPIVLPDTAAAPKDYTLSGAQELALKTVRALIDGSGAASPFLPTLQLLDPNGHVMWEGATPTTVAAGGSADVSWFPGLGSSSSGGGGGSTNNQWAYIGGRVTTTVCPPGTTSLTADPVTFYTNNAALYALALNGGIDGISLLAVGHYLITCTAFPFGVPAAGSLYEIQNTGGDSDANFFGGRPVARIPAGAINDEGVVNVQNVMTVRAGHNPTSAVITQIVNSGGGGVTMLYGGMMIMQLDTDGTNLT